MEEIKIEKGITFFKSKYPFKDMEVGDSFFMEKGSQKDMRSLRSSIGNSMRRYVKKIGDNMLFATRTVIEDGKLGIRCWRLK